MENIKPDRNNINYFREIVMDWHSNFEVDYPWRSTSNLWHAITAEIMLQRTKASQVLPVYKYFISRFNTPAEFLKEVKKSNENIFCKLGLTWRNEVFLKAAEYLRVNNIPHSYDEFLRVPGIGEYVASAVLSFHMNQRAILIDSNIVRLYARFFGFDYNNETRRKKWIKNLANEITPQKSFKSYNMAILDFSMNICQPKPLCQICSLKRECLYVTRNEGKNEW